MAYGALFFSDTYDTQSLVDCASMQIEYELQLTQLSQFPTPLQTYASLTLNLPNSDFIVDSVSCSILLAPSLFVKTVDMGNLYGTPCN